MVGVTVRAVTAAIRAVNRIGAICFALTRSYRLMQMEVISHRSGASALLE